MLFICYSHENEEFVNRLVARLMEQRVKLWWDRARIKVGESLLQKIQGAIAEADYLALVLSKASVQSEWCKEELNAAFMRQLAEKRAIVLPVLIEPCNIPTFLRDKKYADFRTDFENGFQELRESIDAIEDILPTTREDDEYHTHVGIEWNILDDRFVLEIDGVSFSKKEKYSVMTRVRILGNEVATRRYKQYLAAGLDEVHVLNVVASCQELFDVPDAHVKLDTKAVELAQGIIDNKTGVRYDLTVWARCVGNTECLSVLYHFGAIFGGVIRDMLSNRPQLSDEEKRKLRAIVSSPAR